MPGGLGVGGTVFKFNKDGFYGKTQHIKSIGEKL
jgi:hypothetical protein